MTTTLTLVLCSAILTWLTVMAASLIRARGWTLPGMLLALGNRDAMPATDAFAGRAERTARNTMENFVFFAVIALVAHAAGVTDSRLTLGAQLFFWSRVVYVPVYYIGVPYLRTVVWSVGIVGMLLMILTML